MSQDACEPQEVGGVIWAPGIHSLGKKGWYVAPGLAQSASSRKASQVEKVLGLRSQGSAAHADPP